jgi:hypothetical protein
MTTSAPKTEPVERIELVLEPSVVCKGADGAKDCKQALLSGPYDARKATHSNKLSLGVIGIYELVDPCKQWLLHANDFVESEPSREIESDLSRERFKMLFPDYPGTDVAFEKHIAFDPAFEARINASELRRLNAGNEFMYFEGLLELIESKLSYVISAGDKPPDVVLLLLSDAIYDVYHIIGDYHRKLKPPKHKKVDENQLEFDLFKDFDTINLQPQPSESALLSRNLRSAIKKIAMNPTYGVPVQIIRESTIRGGRGRQNRATRTWNLCTGLYYKTGNLPWILDGLDPETCFLGLSFFHRKTAQADFVFSSMAHLFSNDFNSIVLRGGRVRYDEKLKSAVLDRDKIADLVTRGLKAFEGNRGKNPKRLVIHKTSAYTPDEIEGVQDAVRHLNIALDLVSITKTPFRFVRWGKYPVPRGTTYVATERDAFLYTKGFVPELQTYPGSHIPAPFHVHRAVGDSDIIRICSDILALTKLNWNTADFCCGVPITLSFARNVGDVFKEFGEDATYQPSEFFRFYM